MNRIAPLRESKQTERITFELKEMSPAEKQAFWNRYINRLPRALLNILCPCLCLSALAWLIPALGKSYWMLHEPGSYLSVLIWLTLVVIASVWQIYGLFGAIPLVMDSIRLLREQLFTRVRRPK